MILERKILQFLDQPSVGDFEVLALEVYQFQRAQNAVFSRYCDYLEIPLELDSWKDIPGVPQQAFKHSELRSYPAELDSVEFRTSGTTGEGYGRHFFPTLRLYDAAVQRTWDHFRLPRNPFLLLMQHPDDAPFSSLSRMGGVLNGYQREFFFVTQEGELEVDRFRAAIEKEMGPVTVFGTALAYLNLFESFVPIELPAQSMALETGGFKGSGRETTKSALYLQFTNYFRIEADSIWNEYGMTELSSQFYSYGVDRTHLGPPWVRFLVIDPHSNKEASQGEIGLLRIIDLTNLWSVIGIQTQDLAVASPDGGFLLLGRDPAVLPRGCSRAMDNLLGRERRAQ
jgi:hypothetical protein